MNSMKTKFQVFSIAIILFSIVFYASNQKKHSNKSVEWINTWLTSPLCNPPCWEGITPGITTIDQSYAILNNHRQIISISKDPNYVTWYFEPKNKSGAGLLFSEGLRNGTIEIISLTPEKGDLLLGDVIGKFGEPDQVMFTGGDTSAILTYLVYPKQGMALVLWLEAPYVISSTSNIHGVNLFIPGYDFNGFNLTMVISQVKWAGYSRYDW